jgi:hypothetical protein
MFSQFLKPEESENIMSTSGEAYSENRCLLSPFVAIMQHHLKQNEYGLNYSHYTELIHQPFQIARLLNVGY